MNLATKRISDLTIYGSRISIHDSRFSIQRAFEWFDFGPNARVQIVIPPAPARDEEQGDGELKCKTYQKKVNSDR
jgi:hypothetical protein